MGRPRTNIITVGMKRGHLTVLRIVKPDYRGIKRYRLECDCGNVVTLGDNHFVASRRFCSQRCALLSGQRVIDLTGRRFGEWVVKGRVGSAHIDGSLRRSTWWCVCDCGTERTLAGVSLSAGYTLSCGCLPKRLKATGRTAEEEIEAKRERCRLANKKNAARVRANGIKYRNKLSSATPDWLTEEHWAQMNAVYAEARRLTKDTGVRHDVDHMHPINGKTLSGLHVPWNLQILTQAKNVAKSNRYAELSGD